MSHQDSNGDQMVDIDSEAVSLANSVGTSIAQSMTESVAIPANVVDSSSESSNVVAKSGEQASETRPRFEVKKWSAVAFWSWDIVIETCAICRNHIMDICIDCQATNGGASAEECTVSWGMCNHTFHSHCITRWLKSRPVCPLDNQPWELQKYGH